MGNQHSHSEDYYRHPHNQNHNRRHHHHHHSNKYNISTNHHKVRDSGHGSSPSSSPSDHVQPINNTKSTNNGAAQLTIANNTLTNKNNDELVNSKTCICVSLQFTATNEFINNGSSAHSSYELVEIGGPSNNKRSAARRPSYTWRKISHEEFHHKRLQEVAEKQHHRECPLFTSIATVSNPNSGQIVSTMNSLEKFSKHLATLSGSNGQISKEIFQTLVFPHCPILSEYVWSYLNDYAEKCPDHINEQRHFRAADKIYLHITDKDQIQFWFKVFGKGKDVVDKHDFKQFLLCNYQLSTSKANVASKNCQTIEELDGQEWIEAVVKACYHLKNEMSIIFLSNWISNNLPRLHIPLHKYVIHQFTTGYTQLTSARTSISNGSPACQNQSSGDNLNCMTQQSPEANRNEKEEMTKTASATSAFFTEPGGTVSTMNSILLWLLTCSLPMSYVETLKKKPELRRSIVNTLTPKQLITQLINNASDPDSWTVLYNANEHGSSINRFQFHVFHYRGPTLMFITADNGYKICLACDVEWKESCHFWGGEDSLVLQLEPEFRVIERGQGVIYANFSIRGYTFGLQAGKDPRNVSVEIKPDFEYISFKKIPCKIENIVVYGCSSTQTKVTQTEYKKWEAKECEKQKKVNLNPVEWKNNPDKYLLELAGSYQTYGN